MVRDVHVERLVVGHRPGHAELVGQVVPEPAVALPLDDAALEIGRRAGGDVPRIDVEPLQQGLARPGKLLHGVHDDHRVVDSQKFRHRLVGKLVDARLVPAQIDRHAIGNLVVEGRQDALPGGHGFAGHETLACCWGNLDAAAELPSK